MSRVLRAEPSLNFTRNGVQVLESMDELLSTRKGVTMDNMEASMGDMQGLLKQVKFPSVSELDHWRFCSKSSN